MSDYRYLLDRTWSASAAVERVLWVMLNPSSADGHRDDPTIRRCVGFSARYGAAALTVVNLYALRSAVPAALWAHPDPVGPDNDEQLHHVLRAAAMEGWPVVCAWGVHGRSDRTRVVTDLIRTAGCTPLVLGLTSGGQPRHPLYVPGRNVPVPWATAAESSAVC